MRTSRDRLSILIVEDEALIADYLGMFLEENGFRVVGIAASGEAALELAHNGHPDLALIDIKLNGAMDGIELASHLRGLLTVGAIFTSGSWDPQTVARTEAVGALAFLRKPFKPAELLHILDAVQEEPPA